MENKKIHYPLIRTIYLYLFALVGLTLLIIGLVRFIDMGFKAFIFTQAEEQERLYNKQPPIPRSIELAEKIGETQGDQELTEAEINSVRQWLADYENWQEMSLKVDSVTSSRHRDASTNSSMILVGLPLFLYHWRIIRRETRK